MKHINVMVDTSAVQQNEMLSALVAEGSDHVADHLTLVDLPSGAVLDETEHADPYAYFPIDAVVSLMSMLENGKSAEIGVVGNEGLVGIEGMIGGRNPYVQAKVQCAGTAVRVSNRLLRHEFNHHSGLRGLILRYIQSMMVQIGQAAICYRNHSVEQQFCRKLLMSSDRLGSNELALTQCMIADLLGVRREGITAAAGELRKLGVIEYHRGHIRILDRATLEERSCECYGVLQSQAHQCSHKNGTWPAPQAIASTMRAAASYHVQARA